LLVKKGGEQPGRDTGLKPGRVKLRNRETDKEWFTDKVPKDLRPR